MSARQRITADTPPRKRKAVTLSTLAEKKALGEPIVMVTAYDYPSASVAEEAVRRGELDAAAVVAAARHELDEAGIEPEYVELRSASDLTPAERVNGSTLLALAARVGRARLIDNTMLKGPGT